MNTAAGNTGAATAAPARTATGNEVRARLADLDAAFNAGDLERVAAFWHPDIEYTAPGVELRGSVARASAEQAWFTAFPDGRVRPEQVYVLADPDSAAHGDGAGGVIAVVEGRLTGTHLGPLQSADGAVPASGRSIDGAYVAVLRLDADGLIVRQRISYDRLDLLNQLGLGQA